MSALVTSTERLQRLLALVPYVVSRKSVGLAETAEAFGVSERELVDDLNLLWCVELRAPDPYCPIDLSYEGGEIVVSQAESIGRPLRLAVDEASALLVALRMLAEVPGLEDRSAMSRLIAKLEAAAGEAASASAQVAVQVDFPDEEAERLAAQIRAALSAGRRLHLRYYVPGRDEATERDVDPMRLLVVEGRPYLEGWCLRAEGVRLFRLDRVLGLEVLDVRRRSAGRGRRRGRRRGPVPAVARRRRPSYSNCPPRGAGWRSTIRASRPQTCPMAGCGWCCAPRIPAGCGGWPCGSARTAGSSRRLRWPPMSARPPRPPWRTMSFRPSAACRAPNNMLSEHGGANRTRQLRVVCLRKLPPVRLPCRLCRRKTSTC